MASPAAELQCGGGSGAGGWFAEEDQPAWSKQAGLPPGTHQFLWGYSAHCVLAPRWWGQMALFLYFFVGGEPVGLPQDPEG